MKIEAYLQSISPERKRLVAKGALLLFTCLTLDAVVRQRSFRAALLPAVGMAAAALGLWKSRSTPIKPPPYTPPRSLNEYVREFQDQTLETVPLTPPLSFIKRSDHYFAVQGGEVIPLSEALFKAFEAQHKFGRFIPLLEGEKRDLRQRALTPDDQGQIPLLRWEPKETFFLLESSIPEAVQQQLFLHYAANDALSIAQDGFDEEDQPKTFFTQCPMGILAIRKLEKSPLFTAALKAGKKDHVERLIVAMQRKGVPFTDEEWWVVRAVRDSTAFPDALFTDLPEEQREAIYRIANGWQARGLIEKLQQLGMKRDDFASRRLAIRSMLAPDMDLFAAEAAVKGYFQGLRQEGRLPIMSEFSRQGYRKANFERLLGADFIRSVASQLGCDRVTAPRMVAALPEGSYPFSVNLSSLSCPATVYAENILSVDRKREIDEVVQLMRVVWHAQFCDFSQGNILTTATGFCVVDTEFDSFRGRVTLEQLQGFAHWVPEESRPALLEEAAKICQEVPLRDQNSAISRAHFDHHPHRKLIDIIGSVTIEVSTLL